MNRTRTLRTSLLVAVACLGGCKFPYPGDIEDAAEGCAPSTTTCTRDELTVCDATGLPTSTTPCAFGCFTSGDRCADLAPSNGLGMYLDQARAAQPLILTEHALLNTDTGQLTVDVNVPITTAVVSSGPTEILVIIARSFEARSVRVTGSRALAIVSDGDVHLRGDVSMSAFFDLTSGAALEGPGASTTSDPDCSAGRGAFNAMGYSGAGGGGHGTAGGRGGSGNGAMPGVRGELIGSDALVPLRGGCPGAQAWGAQDGSMGPRGGGGGGALQISTRGAIVFDPAAGISANGAGAVGIVGSCPFAPGDPPFCNAGSGGGAGGGILLEAARLEVPVSAALTANGGGGTCRLDGSAESGGRNETPAGGQDCTAVADGGSGGSGGAGVLSGFNGRDGTVTGGGGGGGAGRIRINLPAGVAFDPSPPIVSPVPSVGAASTR